MDLLLGELHDFVTNHRPHGELVAGSSEITANGYRLTVTCPCGVRFERWITPQDAAAELALLARWN